MKNAKNIIAIIGGPKFSGKSSIAKLLKIQLNCADTSFENYHGINICQSDRTNITLMRATKGYISILKTLSNAPPRSDYVFDNIILSEEVFLKMHKGYEKFYPFNRLMLRLNDLSEKFHVVLIISYIKNIGLYKQRAFASGIENHDCTESYKEQSEYLSFIDEIKNMYPDINIIYIATDDGEDGIRKELKKIEHLKRD